MGSTTIAIHLVTGVPGIGKSTAIRQAAAGANVLNVGTLMLEQAARQGLNINRDDLRQLPRADRERLRSLAIRGLPASCILDVHLSTRGAQGLEPALPSELLDRPLGCIIILQAEPAVVLQRRASRIGRSDPHDALEDIAKQQDFNLNIARSLKTSAVVVIDAGRPIGQVVAAMDQALEEAASAPQG